MDDKVFLLVEDNPVDVSLTQRAFKKASILNEIVVAQDGKEERDLVEGYSLGCNSYVRKPVDFDQFAEAVRQLGLYWMVLNEAPPARKG